MIFNRFASNEIQSVFLIDSEWFANRFQNRFDWYELNSNPKLSPGSFRSNTKNIWNLVVYRRVENQYDSIRMNQNQVINPKQAEWIRAGNNIDWFVLIFNRFASNEIQSVFLLVRNNSEWFANRFRNSFDSYKLNTNPKLSPESFRTNTKNIWNLVGYKKG